jgi:cytochrome P450
MTTPIAADALTMAEIYRPEHLADPYPLYRRIREISPVYWDRRMGDGGAWMVTGYVASLEVLRDPRFSARRPQWDPAGPEAAHSASLRALAAQLFAVDPPAHTRLRDQIRRPFLPRPVERLRAEIERGANDLLDAVVARGAMDLMADFAMVLPGATLGRLLGVPEQDRSKIWRRILSWGLLVDGGPAAHENLGYHLAGVGKYMDYFREQLRRRREQRTDDVLQLLADSYDEGAFASEEELLSNLMFLLTAGQSTTTHQIGNTVLALLADPDTLARVTADPGVVPAATPEFMRYDCSVQLTKRRAVEPVELAGQRVEPGQELFVWMGAANRDPRTFPEPDRIDIDRPKIQNLALGHGIHYCLGGQLGQMVNEIAVQVFAERIRNPRVDLARVERSTTPTFRGPHVVPLTFG